VTVVGGTVELNGPLGSAPLSINSSVRPPSGIVPVKNTWPVPSQLAVMLSTENWPAPGVVVGVSVATPAGVLVAVAVFVGTAVLVGVFVGVLVGTPAGVLVAVGVSVGTAVLVGVFVGTGVLVGVSVGPTGVLVGVFVGGTGVLVGVFVAVAVAVFVAVFVGTAVFVAVGVLVAAPGQSFAVPVPMKTLTGAVSTLLFCETALVATVYVSSDAVLRSSAGRSTRCVWMQPSPVALKMKLARRPEPTVVKAGSGSAGSVTQARTFSPAAGVAWPQVRSWIPSEFGSRGKIEPTRLLEMLVRLTPAPTLAAMCRLNPLYAAVAVVTALTGTVLAAGAPSAISGPAPPATTVLVAVGVLVLATVVFVGVGVLVGGTGVLVGVLVAVFVRVGVLVAVLVGVFVRVGVLVAVLVRVAVAVLVGVSVGAAPGQGTPMRSCAWNGWWPVVLET
jgi:hypothetical protein